VETISKLNAQSTIENVGKPINSSYDDFGYIINENTRKGFVTSNRLGGKGDDDIYAFAKAECKQIINGIVVSDKGDAIADAVVTITGEHSTTVKELRTDTNGTFNYATTCHEDIYEVIATKEAYEDGSSTFTIAQTKKNEETDVQVVLKQIPPKPKAAAVGTDLFKLLNLNPIYFDYDKSYIRPDAEVELAKIIAYMKEFSTVKVDVRSHTDARGRDAYNLSLSQRRNASTLKYLVEKGGISTSRLSGKGYGETQLTNDCGNGVSCSKEQHQANRRSEFIVVSN